MTQVDHLALDPRGPGRYAVRNEGDAERRDVVFGGQFLAQMIAAAVADAPGRTCRTIHAVFARSGRIDADTELAVEVIHAGRTFASVTVTARQGNRVCSRGQVLLDNADPDLIAHSAPMPFVDAAEATPVHDAGNLVYPGAEARVVGGVDLWSVDEAVGPPELYVWTRDPAAPGIESSDEVVANQARFAWGTDGFLIATAMRPHPGVNQDLAHHSVSTGVISHTLTFHRPFSLADWVLMAFESPFAGEGRTYGRMQAFAADGTLVASLVQDNIVRAFHGEPDRSDHHKTVM